MKLTRGCAPFKTRRRNQVALDVQSGARQSVFMIELRPVTHSIASIVTALGVSMLLPAAVDWWHDDPHFVVFLQAGALTGLSGLLVGIATAGPSRTLTIRQAFLFTSGLWLVLSLFGTLPFMMGATAASPTDAWFESMSGVTTTGVTIFAQLDGLPRGIHLWRVMLHWIGGLGIVVVAMVFLPAMRVGGMQFFRSEGFDTMGKILPRAGQIAAHVSGLYLFLTGACMTAYILLGMSGFDAVIQALSTVSTGGFSNHDAGFASFGPGAQWAGAGFMVLATIPFIRMVQAMGGQFGPLARDVQIRAYLRWIASACVLILAWRLARGAEASLPTLLRETVFSTVSVFSGTGFANVDIAAWGAFPLAVLVICGLIGGCTGSTGCSVKVFRWLVLLRAVQAQLRRMHSPHRIYPLRFAGRVLEKDVVDSVIAFLTLFMLSFGLLIVALSLTGLHPRTALSAAWTSIANIGPVWGPEITANGSVAQLPDAAKRIMIIGMYLGRLELVSVLVLLLPRFWRG